MWLASRSYLAHHNAHHLIFGRWSRAAGFNIRQRNLLRDALGAWPACSRTDLGGPRGLVTSIWSNASEFIVGCLGHGAVIHACTIEDDCLVGMGATVLDGSQVRHALLVPTSFVHACKELPNRNPTKALTTKSVPRPHTCGVNLYSFSITPISLGMDSALPLLQSFWQQSPVPTCEPSLGQCLICRMWERRAGEEGFYCSSRRIGHARHRRPHR